MKLILSTKILPDAQHHQILQSKLSLVHYNAITTRGIQTDMSDISLYDYLIFTSQNALKYYLEQNGAVKPCFCVGDKTKSALEAKGFPVIAHRQNAKELGKFLVSDYGQSSFVFLCSDLRRRISLNY